MLRTKKGVILYFDGGSRGNPGPSASGAVIVNADDGKKEIVSQFFRHATNNVAEYNGLIIGLEKALELGLKNLTVCGDSNLVVNQVNGRWQVKNNRLRVLCDRAKQLIKQFDRIEINWVRRNQNQLADRAVNECLDRALGTKNETVKVLPAGVSEGVSKIILLGESARFKDFAKLKSGRDEFTAKKLPTLKKLVNDEIKETIDRSFNGLDKYLAKVYRWHLRGLPIDLAIRKVKVDAEIEANVTGRQKIRSSVRYSVRSGER